ncbi:MAG: hypothetical protein A2252_04255 [Elusimicrobia bacterium RIFOXYA2_FULL_39_19]|nr:MAG: hypothetical protein A2252_04255 [Elusimicrobia bacterium RIFOXYA2_FULL_39_19]
MNQDFWKDADIISVYSLEEAVLDGMLIRVGQCGKYPIIFTANLFHEVGFEDRDIRVALVQKGLEMLKVPDPEDTNTMRLRVIEVGRIWCIADPQAITFMRPEDY